MAEAPAITVCVPRAVRATCAGAAEVVVYASTVQRMLDELERCYPEFHRSVCYETGRVRPHINVFVNSEHMRQLDGLDTVLHFGDVIMILPAVSGG